MDGPKNGFYPIQMCLWLKEDNNEALVWWYVRVSSTKSLLDYLKSMNKLNWSKVVNITTEQTNVKQLKLSLQKLNLLKKKKSKSVDNNRFLTEKNDLYIKI